MKAFRGSDRRSRVGKEVVRCLVDTQAIALPPLVLSRTRCTCCDNTTIRCPGSFDRKVQSARSYESLLVAAGRIPSVDLGDGHIQVTPLHRSMLGEGNCIRLTSSAGSCTYYSCRNSEEASQWLNQ
ncbi:hypothetical protein EB796_010189 [Bugula neritina]|uniref:Ras/Rap GTPase-activating protein SynGAP-like PH domain-containing protein n=1 Tax=Bugula neritina TaxID=10212 RepID=A0A7J7JZT9_BUGNE|nr:hypothetical protein EB796_010189 [Bugula neritina]